MYAEDGYYYLIPQYNTTMRLEVYYDVDTEGQNVSVWEHNTAGPLFRILPSKKNTFTIRPQISSNRVLDVESSATTNNANVIINTQDGRESQDWYFELCTTSPVISGQTYYIRNAYSNRYLDAETTKNVAQYQFNGGANQQWRCMDAGNGNFYLIPQHNTAMRLEVYYDVDADGQNISIWEHNTAGPLFRFNAAGNGSYYIQPAISGTRVIEVQDRSTSSGANVVLNTKTGSDNQKWYFEPCLTDGRQAPTITSGSTYYIRNLNSGKYLDVNTGNDVRQKVFTGGANQQWKVVYHDNGYYYFIPQSSDGQRLEIYYDTDEDGTNVDTYWYQGENYLSLFRLVSAEDGSFYIQPKCSDLRDIVVQNASSSDNANVFLWKRGSDDNGKWVFEPADPAPLTDGASYYIRNAASNKYLNMNTSTDNVTQYAYNGTANQRWKCVYHTDGYYYLLPEYDMGRDGGTGKCLDITYGVDADGTNVDVFSYVRYNDGSFDGHDEQLFRLLPTGNGSFYIQPKTSTNSYTTRNPNRNLEVANSSTANNANVQIRERNGSDNQKWYFDLVTTGETYHIRNEASGKNLHVNTSTYNADQYQYADSTTQEWICSYSSDGYYTMTPAYTTSKRLHVAGGDVEGSNVSVNTTTSGDQQRFQIIPASDGSSYIKPKTSATRVVQIANGSTANSANVQLGSILNKEQERWRFDGDTIKVMSANVLNDAGGGEPFYRGNPYRMPGVIWSLKTNKPDAFGVQEGAYYWINTIAAAMPDYAYVGKGLNGTDHNDCGQINAIFYRKDKYAVVEWGTFYYTDTPDIPSVSPLCDPNYPEERNCTWARLRNKITGQTFIQMNTHLDAYSARARDDAAIRLAAKIKSLRSAFGNPPVFCTGDFNSSEEEQPYATLTNNGLKDARAIAATPVNAGETFNNLGAPHDYWESHPMDFCFVSNGDINVDFYTVLRDKHLCEYNNEV